MIDQSQQPKPELALPAPRTRKRPPRCERTRRAARSVIRAAPHLEEVRYRPLVLRFAQLHVLAGDAFEHLRRVGLLNQDGELRASVDVFQRLAMAQLRLAEKLGLTPAALGKLGKTKPIDLAAAMSEAEVVSDGKAD